jgi:hypothetical protein
MTIQMSNCETVLQLELQPTVTSIPTIEVTKYLLVHGQTGENRDADLLGALPNLV